MFLAIDIGNTHTVLALADSEQWVHSHRIESTQPEEAIVQALHLWYHEQCSTQPITGIGISSVVPALTHTFVSFFHNRTSIEPLVISAHLDLGITVRYDNPLSLGTDRICSSVAAYTKYGGPLIVVDFGTATTYDCLSSNGTFLGGVIAPGIYTSAASLAQRTAQLPVIELVLPPTAMNTNTISSIQAGVLYGALDAFERMIDRLTAELSHYDTSTPTLVLTGGFSQWISHQTSRPHVCEPMLVLDGIRLLWQRNRGTKR